MKLNTIMKGLDILEWYGNSNLSVTDICYHSNRVVPGSAFVAIEGLKSDGHKYIADALSRGAAALVVSKKIEAISALANLPDEAAIIRVKDTRIALSKMATNLTGRPSEALKMIGVTGTNGKTTITYLIHAILEKRVENAGQIGSLGIYINNKWRDSTHTTPESLELQKVLRDMLNSGLQSCVMEVSSHALELSRVRDIAFDGAVFTNLTHEHLDFHETMEQYYEAKRKLFLMTDSFNVVNTDDAYGRRLANELSSGRKARLITYGLKGNADFKAHSIHVLRTHTEFQLATPVGEIGLKTFLPGKYNVYNCLAAAACAYMLDLELSEIKAGLEQVRQIPGRFEVISTHRNVNIIIDYAHTPDGFEQLLETVSCFATGRIVMVFGCVGERDQSKRSIMGEIASRYSDLCVLTTDNCRSEEPKDIISQVREGFRFGTNYVEILDREDAIRYAILNSKENDTILITGKGHEQRQIIGDRSFYFNEKEIVTAALNDLARRINPPREIGQVSV